MSEHGDFGGGPPHDHGDEPHEPHESHGQDDQHGEHEHPTHEHGRFEGQHRGQPDDPRPHEPHHLDGPRDEHRSRDEHAEHGDEVAVHSGEDDHPGHPVLPVPLSHTVFHIDPSPSVVPEPAHEQHEGSYAARWVTELQAGFEDSAGADASVHQPHPLLGRPDPDSIPRPLDD